MTAAKRAATAIYNPHLLSRDDLVATFVARQDLLNELLDDLRRGGGQHHLLVGARGAGKTTLLLRLAHAIDDDKKLARTCVPLRFPEEQYNVARPSDFWINCVDALTDQLERRGDSKTSAELDAAVASLEDLDEKERSARALTVLTACAKRTKKLLVLLVDNLDLVLDRLHDAHWALREVLSADNGLVLIGASSTFVQETFAYGSPFYDFFNVHELGALSKDEARDLILHLARTTGTPHVERSIAEDPGRFEALYVLTGGTPRTLALLHGILAADKTTRVEEDLEEMLDQLTPYYKARFDDLPSQSQVIVDAVALNWHPITAAECAAKTRHEVNVVSAQLNRLSQQGVIAKVALPGARKLGFQISERFFNIWYLMRASRRLRRRLAWFVEFLRIFYGDEDLERRAQALLATADGKASSDAGPATLLGFASAVGEAPLRKRLELRAIEMLIKKRRPEELRELLDLDGEDAHLAPVLNRAQALRDVRRRITRARVVWPKGETAASYAEAFASNPLFTIQEKIEFAETVSASPALQANFIKHCRSTIKLYGTRLATAIGKGEVPSLAETATPSELDEIVLLSEQRMLAVMMVISKALSRNDEFLEPLLQRALTIDASASAAMLLHRARDEVEAHHWPIARGYALHLLRHPSLESVEEALSPVRQFLRACVQYGLAGEALALLDEAGAAEKLLPLYEALRAAATNPPGSLAHLAPEVRIPAEDALKGFLQPEKRTEKRLRPAPSKDRPVRGKRTPRS